MQRSSIRSVPSRPKISTMPRQRSEAAALLDLYKLVVEKKRLQQELESFEQRRQDITHRLEAIALQITSTESTIQAFRRAEETPSATANPSAPAAPHKAAGAFSTMYLEY